MQASNTQAVQAMQHVHNDKQRMKDEYQNIRRQQMNELQKKRADILKQNIEKQRESEERQN